MLKDRPGNTERYLLPFLAISFLSLATWLYIGYRYDAWPQPGFLAHVLKFSGELKGDWYTSFPPGHWAIDHLLAFLPNSLLEPSIFLLWLLFLVLLWGAFLSICRSLGASLLSAVAAGLVLIPTGIGGFGASEALLNLFYPNGLSTSFLLVSLAFLLRRRFGLAGGALGLAILVHPGVGMLGALALVPTCLYLLHREGGLFTQATWRFVVPAAVFGLPACIQLLSSTTGGALSPEQQYDIVTLVRTPHHYLYRAFSADDYWRTAVWTAVLAISVGCLWRNVAARVIALLTASMAALCVVGAVASDTGWSNLIITAQTSRLSGLVVLLAVAASAAAFTRLVGASIAAIFMLGTFLLAPALHSSIGYLFSPGVFATSVLNADEAMIVFVGLLAALAVTRVPALGLAAAGDQPVPRPGPKWVFGLRWVAAGLLIVALVSMISEHAHRVSGDTPDEKALKQVAAVARDHTRSGQLVMGSPTMDGLRVWDERPDVVEFGSIRIGDGDLEWQKRIFDLTGDPHILDPEPLGTDVVTRGLRMEQEYQRQITHDRTIVCRYKAVAVVARPLQKPPPWLTRIYQNEYYELLRVDPSTCPGSTA